MPKYKPLYSLYKGLKESKYDVPDSYVSFQKTLTQPGNAGAKSRRGLYQSLKDSNYDVPDTYEDFYKNLFVPVNSTTSRALKIGENPNTPTVNRYRQKMFDSVDPNKNGLNALSHRAVGQAVRATNNVRKPVVAKVVNRKGKPTGEEFAITPAKTVEDLDREYAQETTKNWENELHDQMADADKDAAKISDMFKSFIGSTDEVGSVWGNMTRGGGIAGTPHSVTTNNGILENTEARQLLAAGDYNRKRRELLQLEKDSRNGAIFDNHSFFRGMYDAAKDTGFLTGGASDLINAGSLLATKQDLDNGVHTEAGDMLMQQAVKNSDAQSQYGDNQGWMYTGGVITTNMAPFMVQIGSAGFSKGMSNTIGKVVQGAASKVALGTMEKATGMVGAHIANYIGKVTGLTTKAFGKAIQYGIVGAAQANTVGLGNVANDVINRYTGQVYQDEQGNYKFGTFDSDGKLVHEGGEDFLTSLVKGEAAQTIEFATELAGGGIDAAGTALKNFVTKGGKKIINKYNMENVSKVIDFFLNNKVSKNARYLKAGADRTLGKVEVNSIVGESLEEELGIIANTVFTGDNKISDLWDDKQQSQIWGGMLLSIGLMKGAVAPFHAYNAKQYYSYKHKLDKADVNLSQLLGKEKWEELRNQIDATTNDDMPEMVNKINRDVALGKNRQPVREYIQNLLIMRGYDIGNMLAAKKAVEDKGKGVSVKNMEKNQAYQQGRDAYGYDTHEIQLDQADKQKTLAQLLGITEQQLSTMSDEELDNLSGRDDNLDKAIYDYQLSTIRYQGVADNAQDQVDLAAQKAAQAVDMYTDKSRNTIRNATIKATGGLEDYGVYIINGNIATHDDGSIDVGNSDDMILFYDPTTNTVEHADATRFAELGSEENADEVRNQAVADAKENAIKEITGIIDGVVEVGTQFKTIDADGTEHTYEVLADNGDGTAMITIDGNIPTQLVKGENVNVPVSFEELQKMKDASDQQRLQAAKAQREQMEKERAEQQMQAQTTQAENPAQEDNIQSAPIEDNLDYSDILREDGKVQMVDVSDKDGNNLFPDAKDVFYIQGNKMRTKFAYIDANGELKAQNFPTGLVKIKTRGEVSVDDYKKYRSMILSAESPAMPESSMIEDNSGTIEANRSGIEVEDNTQPLSEADADNVISQMESSADTAPDLELTPDNWTAEFGEDGTLSTPIGDVKMGENQVAKLFEKGRSKEFGMIKPTLTDPDVIIEVPSHSADGNEERSSSYLFIKTFLGKNGEKVYYFKSVTIKKDGLEISISSHYDRAKRVKEALMKGKLLYRKNDGAQTEQNQPSASVTTSQEDAAGSSESKDTNISSNGNENNESLTFEDGTPIPVDVNGEVDLSQTDAAHAAEWYDTNLGEDADGWLDGEINKAKKVLEQAKNRKLTGTKPSELVASKKEKEAAIADAQARYDYAISIRDSLKERRIAKEENTPEGRKNLIEKARRKFSRLKSAVKDDAEAVSQLYKDVVGSLLHRLYDGTGIDVTDTIPLTAGEYVASNLGAHSLNYEGTETSKGVKQETGLSREDFAKTQLLAADGKGTTIDDLVHSLWENRPSNLESLDTQNIRNALIGVLTSGFKASEARNYIENLRIAQAENILEEQKKAADNAVFAEEQKAPAEEQTETTPESEEKTEENNSDKINDEENEQTNAPEQNKFPDKLKEGSKTIEVPDDATEENPLGLQLSEDKVPFEIEGGKSGETYNINDNEDRQRLINDNKVDDKDILDIDMPKHVHKAIKELCKKMGLKVQFLYMGARSNGWIENGTMYLALDTEKATQFVFGHEMTHAIKQKNPEAYKELVKVAMAVTTRKKFEEDLAKVYQNYHGISGYNNVDDFVEEVVADNLGKFINDFDLAQKFYLRLNHPVLATILHAIQEIKHLLYGDFYKPVDALERIVEQAYVKTANGQVTNSETGEDVSFSLRQKPEPKKKGIGYKVFVLKDGKLYPPMVANPNGAATPVGVWLDADAAPITGESKTGRPQVKQGGKGTQGGSGKIAYRPGWHLGVVPYAIQFNRKDAEGNKTLFPKNFVFAEVEYAADVDYQEEARQEGINPSGKYQHSLAGLKHLPTDGYYMYRTNPNPETDPWVITGAMKVNRILTRAEQADLVSKAGREPQQIQEGDIVTDDVVNSINQEIADAPKFSLKVYHGSGADFTEFDFDHMGEGAGSQVFGWGGYVTSSKKIGKNYATLMDNDPSRAYYRIQHSNGTRFAKKYPTLESFLHGDKQIAMNDKFTEQEKIDFYNEMKKLAEPYHNLYEVNIPDDNGSNYLDWDAPITDELIDKVAKALPSLRSYDIKDFKKDRTFDNFYKTISMRSVKDDATFNDDKAASKLLASLGYTGIKYKAGRNFGGAEEGDTNYVIFKPEDMKITEHTKFSLKDIKPVGKNQFGDVYDQFKGKPKEAFDFLLENKDGYLKGVFHRDEIGDIDLAYGSAPNPYKGKGLAHIIRKHVETLHDFPSVDDAINTITDVISNGIVKDGSIPNTYDIENGDYRVVVAADKNGNWVLTAFDYVNPTKKKKKGTATALPPSQSSDGAGAVAPNLSAAKIDNSSETAKENGEKFSLKDEKIKSVAEKFGVNEDDVAMYANAVERGSTAEAARARANIKRYLLQENEDKISSFKDIIKYTKPINEALKENFGDLDAMIEERRKQVEAQRNAMEAARKRAQEEEEKRQKHLDELSLIPTDELDKRYMDAIANNDESTAREMLDESARRKGYGDADSNYQGQGAWAAPSNPQYESDEARRADIENSPDVNLEDIALGYNLQPDDYFDNPRAYMNNTAYGLESAHVIKNALDAIKNGEKDVKVKVYRAVPTSVKEGKLRNGDWVTPSKKYAEMHGDNRLDGKYRIIEDEVPANQLWWDGNDVNEFGFDDGKEYRYKNAKNNRKLNDLITYDNKGNVIPPSKRFNSRKSDIRFSLKEEKEKIVADAKANGTYMTAPNGEKTKLDAEQWATARTANFKNWFGDWENDPENASKVVDENGEPMVVWHGRSAEFNTFEKKEGVRFIMGLEDKVKSEGFFFSPDKGLAEEFASNSSRHRGGKANVVPCFLNIRKPMDLTGEDYDRIYEDVTGWEYMVGMDTQDNLWGIMDEEGMADKIKKKGYDGAIFVEEVDDSYEPTKISYCALDANQIKSAENNNGDFSADNNDIRFSLAGERGAAAADKADERTFRMDNLSVARKMEEEKKDAKAIKIATGWERGADGKWRYEMPDAKIKDTMDVGGGHIVKRYEDDMLWNGGKLSDVIDAPELFKAYPHLKDVRIETDAIMNDMPSNGEYNAKTNTITIHADELKYMNSILNHEIQHAIQSIEGFDRGGSPRLVRGEIKKRLAEVTKKIRQLRAEGKEDEAKAVVEKNRGLYNAYQANDDYNSYKSLAGEVEARNVQERMNMTPEERRKTLAESTEDVARKDQIFLGVGDVSFSLRDMADGKESGAADMAEDLKSLNTPGEVDDAINTAIDDMPSGWQMANKKMIHIAQALGENRKAEIAGVEPKFSLKDGTLIKAGTYFSGGGLVEEGLKGIIDPVLAVEYDEKISGVYRNNFGQHIVTADVRDVDPKELVKLIDGEVEYFHASPVCKNYSQAKSNHAEVELDKETAASTAEFINSIKPKVVTIENVKGYKDSDAMKIITDALDANGYTWDADVYNAADYGGYTNRERLIVRAVRDGKLPAKPKKMARKSGWYEAVVDIIPTLTEKKNGVAPWMDIRLKADGIDWRNIDKPLFVMGSAYADGKIPHAFADELLPTLRTKSGDVIVMPDGKVYRAMGRVLARVSGVSDDYKMPFSENLSHTIIGNGIPTQLTEHVIAPLLTGSDPKFSLKKINNVKDSRVIPTDVDKNVSSQIEKKFDDEIEKIKSETPSRDLSRLEDELDYYLFESSTVVPTREALKDRIKYFENEAKQEITRQHRWDASRGNSGENNANGESSFALSRSRAAIATYRRELAYREARIEAIRNSLGMQSDGEMSLSTLVRYYKGSDRGRNAETDRLFDKALDIVKRLGVEFNVYEGADIRNPKREGVSSTDRRIELFLEGMARTELRDNDFTHTILHEMLHQATVGSINLVKKGKAEGFLTPKQIEGVNEILEIYDKVKDDKERFKENTYGLTDAYELTAQMADLRQRKAMGLTIWDKVVNAAHEFARKGDRSILQRLKDAWKKLFEVSDKDKMDKAINDIMDDFKEKIDDISMNNIEETDFGLNGNTRFSLRYDQFEHDLNQWKKDNNLPKDAQRPTIPQRNAGESAVDFLRRVDEYRKQMALWKTAPTYEQHLLSDDTALGEFNRELQKGSVLKRIAFQDSMLAIRKAQEAIMKEVGVDRLNMAEDAYTAENRSHGKGKNEFEEYNNEFLQPLRKAYHQMKKVLGDSYDNVRVYMMAKHGLERDAQMAFKKSLEADYEDVNQRSAAYKAYKNDLDRVSNDADLEFGRVDFTTWRQKDNALRGKYSPSYMDYRYDDNGIAYDYSGLSSLFDGSDFEEAAHRLVRDVENKHLAEVQALWNATNAATKKILRDGFKAGMMSKDAYEYVKGMYSHYIPLRGWDGTTADQVWDYIGGGKGAFNQTLKTAHGRTSIADDPIAYIENMAGSGILLNNKNWVKQHLMLLAQNHPTSLLTLSKAWYVKSTDANGNEEWIPATPQITSQMNSNQVKAAIDAFEQKMEQLAQTGDSTQQRDGLNIAYPQTHSEEREHEVRVMKDGEEYVIYVNGDPQLAQAMNNTRAHRVREIQSGKLDRAAAWLGRKMAAAYTSLSPLFIPSNYFRDLTMTLASTAIREDGRYNYLLRKNLATSWNLGFMLRDYQNGKLREKVSNGNATPKEQMFYDFMMNGGETGFVSSLDVEDLKKKFKNDLKDLDRWKANPVKVGHTIMDSIEFLNRMIEDSNRFAVYMTSIQYGRSIDEAVNDAKDVTLNFNRKGTGEYGWQMIRNLYLFINPAVQSLQTLGALTKHHPFKFTAVTAAWLASGVLVPIVNAALMSLLGGDDDKDKYWQFTKWDRRNNLIMWVPFTHEFVKIPLAQEFRAFYGVGDMIASKMMGGELAEETWSQYAEDLLGQVVDMLPLDPTGYDGNIAVSLMPNPIRPVFELAFNVDFTGKPLFKETEYNKYDPNFTKAYVGTPDWLVRVSKMVNSIGNDYPDVQQNAIDAFGDPKYNLNNPAVVDHVLSSYLGGAYTMGSQVLGVLTKSLNDPKEIKMADIPLVSKFVSNPDDRPVTKKQGDEFWNMKENHDRAANTLSKLKKQAKVDGDYSMLERFYGSEEYK